MKNYYLINHSSYFSDSQSFARKYIKPSPSSSVIKTFKYPSFSQAPPLSTTRIPLQVFNNEFSFFLQENETSQTSIYLPKKEKACQTSFSSESSSQRGAKPLRWVISFCDCLNNVGKFYCMDSALALQTFFYDGGLKLSSLEYNLFYGIYAMFFALTFYSGYFVESKGVRFSFFMNSILVALGQFFFMLGGTKENYGLMLFGRLIFGLGVSCVEVCQDLIITEWFFDRELALALGLSFASCRFGSALTMYFTPKIMNSAGPFEALLTGLGLSLLGVVCVIVIVFIDRNYNDQKANKDDVESFLKDFSILEKGISLQKLKDLGGIFWLMVLNALFVYACFCGFSMNSNDILCSLYGFDAEQACEMISIMFFSAAVTPVAGFVIDRVGKRLKIMIFLLVLLMFPFLNFGILPKEVSKNFLVVSLVFIGLFFSSYASVIWSALPLLIEVKQQTMAFAIIYSTLNVANILSTIYVGVSIDYRGKKDYGLAFLCMILCLCVSFILLWKVNHAEGRKVRALDSFVTNQEIRSIMNEDPSIGEKLLEMIEDDLPSVKGMELKRVAVTRT